MRHLISGLNEHLSDVRMASLLSHELAFAERLIARQHLAMCWYCRIRQEDLEGRRADRMVRLYQEAIEGEELPPSPKLRAEFVDRLERHIQHPVSRKRRTFQLPNISLPELSSMNAALVMSLAFGMATIVSFFFWWQQRAPNITSNALLVRAESWDEPTVAAANGIVFQAVRISTAQHRMERSIYRDPHGKRQLKPVRLAEKDEQLRATLIQAGVDWDEPISASSYQGWHDHQRVRADDIVRAGKHLLRLTTRVPEGLVSEQSLTVRDTDFHPVRRTVAFRDSGTVEIAELDFKILPWNAVDANVFEPGGDIMHAAGIASARVLPFPRMPVSVSEGELDEAELGARLILNQLNADTGEQIEIRRGPHNIEVVGLVDTEERKRVLRTQLQVVPHLVITLQSVTDLKDTHDTNATETSIATASMPNQQSPLETYLQTHGASVSAVNVLTARLFNEALTISQESRAINELQTRFVPGDQKTILASATLLELIYSHHERLQAALVQERRLLKEAQGSSANMTGEAAPAPYSATKGPSLVDAAAQNLALCKELTQTNSASARSAGELLAEMSAAMNDLTATVHEKHDKLQGDSTPSGKK